MSFLSRSSSFVSLFDIRLYTDNSDVILFRGAPDEASGVLLKGVIVLSVADSTIVKKINLRLYGTLRLNWTDTIQTPRGPQQRTTRFEKIVYDHDWTFSPHEGVVKHPHTLNSGNYEYPFELIIPGNIPESLEGLESAALVYKFKATLERGRFSNNMTKKKVVRVIRTLAQDSLELSQTMSIDNTWPDKIDYSITIPSKAVAMGATTPIHLLLVPLLKGLKLGQVVITLKEYHTFHSDTGVVHNEIRTVETVTQPPPSEESLGDDRWELTYHLAVPPSLAKVSPDSDILKYVKIRHKLKFGVSLLNPDGHVSELRASLPVCIFISPNAILENQNGTGSFRPAEGTTFQSDMEPPPSYDKHVYDQLFADLPPSSLIDTPDPSGSSTPLPARSRRGSLDATELGMTQMHPAQLTAGLRALEEQQQQMAGNNGNNRRRNFSSRSTSGSNTPRDELVFSPDQQFLSRRESPTQSPLYTPRNVGSSVDLAALSRVPSYNMAMKSSGNMVPSEDGPPMYDEVIHDGNSGPPSRGALSPQHAASAVSLPQVTFAPPPAGTSGGEGSSAVRSPNRLSFAANGGSSSSSRGPSRSASYRSLHLLEEAAKKLRFHDHHSASTTNLHQQGRES